MSKRPDPDIPNGGQPSAVILDWYGPFAARVMSRIEEYDDAWPKGDGIGSIVSFNSYVRKLKRNPMPR